MISFLLLFYISASYAYHVTWLYPHNDSQTFNVIDTLYLSWISDTVETSMNLWCENDHNNEYEAPLGESKPWNVPSSGSFALNFHIPSKYRLPCHVGFYNQSAAHEYLPSIGNSPNFYLTFDYHTTPKTWGKSVANNLKAQLDPHSQPSKKPHKSPHPSSHPHSHQSGDGSSGLSTAAKAGIGVGIAVGVCAIAAGVIIYFWIRRKRAKQNEKHELPVNKPASSYAPSGTVVATPQQTEPPPLFEKQPVYYHEAPGSTRFLPSELDGTPRSEVDASSRRKGLK